MKHIYMNILVEKENNNEKEISDFYLNLPEVGKYEEIVYIVTGLNMVEKYLNEVIEEGRKIVKVSFDNHHN